MNNDSDTNSGGAGEQVGVGGTQLFEPNNGSINSGESRGSLTLLPAAADMQCNNGLLPVLTEETTENTSDKSGLSTPSMNSISSSNKSKIQSLRVNVGSPPIEKKNKNTFQVVVIQIKIHQVKIVKNDLGGAC